MDGHRFDDLTRALAARSSRRGFVAGLAALAAGLAGAKSAAAACRSDEVFRRNVGCLCKTTGRPPEAGGYCPCPNGQTRCGETCVDLGDDLEHCGACDASCPDLGPCVTRRCRGGVCDPRPVPNDRRGACPAPRVCCGGACTDRAGDLNNCGTCGNICGDGDLCTSDACVQGACQYTAVGCTRGVCEVGACNGTSGECEYDAAPLAGTPCRESAGPCDLPDMCDGANGDCPADQFQPSSVECRPASCAGGVAVRAANCPGTAALCPPEESVACGPYLCDDNGVTCRDFCESNSDCLPSAYCDDNGECLPDGALGAACERDSQCLSGACVGDICCQQDCPAPFGADAICLDGVTCDWVCDDDYTPCGDACCPNGRTCCEGVCCGEGGECQSGECTEVCRPLGESCDFTDQCCLNAFIDCEPVDDSFDDVCCNEVGGGCDSEFGQCCLVETEQDPGYAPVACSETGVCGGSGAACSADEGCVSGACCDGACCAANQACGSDLVCRARAGQSCGAPAECASGLCCGGLCVESNEAHCAACDNVCGAGEECAGGVCLKAIGQTCGSGAECAAGFCLDGVCCDECGGLCGRPRPENTPCGDDPGSYCCSGECLNITPHYFSCGGCNIACPFGDVCTDDHECTCTESSRCVPNDSGATLDRQSCRGGGLCVTSTEGDLACVQTRECGPTCATSADCPATTVCTIVNGVSHCSSDWVCTDSTCCGRRCSVTLPDGRPI